MKNNLAKQTKYRMVITNAEEKEFELNDIKGLFSFQVSAIYDDGFTFTKESLLTGVANSNMEPDDLKKKVIESLKPHYNNKAAVRILQINGVTK